MQNEPPVAPCPHNRAPPSATIETEEDGALTCPDIAEKFFKIKFLRP